MEVVVQACGLCKRFRNDPVLQDVDLCVEKGAIVGIVGSNGSGKSVLFKLLCGLVPPDEGKVYIRGRLLGEKDDFPEDVGILINSPGYIELYSGFRNLKYLAGIRNIVGDADIVRVMEKVGLDPSDDKKVKHYSTGMKQKLGIAQAIMEGQDILLLDEPFNGLDWRSCAEIKDILRRLKDEGKTILLTSHSQTDLEQLCSELYIILDKKLLPLTQELKEQYFLKGREE